MGSIREKKNIIKNGLITQFVINKKQQVVINVLVHKKNMSQPVISSLT